MKVILTAFNGLLKSEIKEWPEMPEDQQIQFPLVHNRHKFSLTSMGIEQFPEPVDLRATFETTGHYLVVDGKEVREYELVDVNPKYWKGDDHGG